MAKRKKPTTWEEMPEVETNKTKKSDAPVETTEPVETTNPPAAEPQLQQVTPGQLNISPTGKLLTGVASNQKMPVAADRLYQDFLIYADKAGLDNPEELPIVIRDGKAQPNPIDKYQWNILKEKYIGNRLYAEVGYSDFIIYVGTCTSSYWTLRAQRMKPCEAADKVCRGSCPYYITRANCPPGMGGN